MLGSEDTDVNRKQFILSRNLLSRRKDRQWTGNAEYSLRHAIFNKSMKKVL